MWYYLRSPDDTWLSSRLSKEDMVRLTSPAAGRGEWRGQPEASGAGALSFAVSSKPRAPTSMLILGGNNHPAVGAAPSAALHSVGRDFSMLRGSPCEGGFHGNCSGTRRRRVRARAGGAVCMMSQKRPQQQLRKATPLPVSSGGARVGVGAAAAAVPSLGDSRQILAAIYACEGEGRVVHVAHVFSQLKCV